MITQTKVPVSGQCQETLPTSTLLEKLESHGVCAMILFIAGLAVLYELNLLRFLSPYRHAIAFLILLIRNFHYYQLHEELKESGGCIYPESSSQGENFYSNIANHSILDWIVNTLTVNLNVQEILFIKDFLGYLVLTIFISWAQNLRHVSFSTMEQQVKEFLFGYAKYIPMVVNKLKEEKNKLETQLDHSLKGALKILEKEGEEKVILTAPIPKPLPLTSSSLNITEKDMANREKTYQSNHKQNNVAAKDVASKPKNKYNLFGRSNSISSDEVKNGSGDKGDSQNPSTTTGEIVPEKESQLVLQEKCRRNFALPQAGIEKMEDIVQLMQYYSTKEKPRWSDGYVSGAVYSGEEEINIMSGHIMSMYNVTNPLHPDLFPSVMKFESEVISMCVHLVNAHADATIVPKRTNSNNGKNVKENGNGSSHIQNGSNGHHDNTEDTEEVVLTPEEKYLLAQKPSLNSKDGCGLLTSGGTESIILATKIHREWYRTEKSVTEPEIVACETAHAAIDKACEILGIKLVKVPIDPLSHKVDIHAMEWAITSKTIMLYASAPQFGQGVIDDIMAISRLGVKYDVGVHVDCCLGGLILPFGYKMQQERKRRLIKRRKLEEQNLPIPFHLQDGQHDDDDLFSQEYSMDLKYACNDIPPFDFNLEGITTMSMDTHKYGYATKGTSCLVIRNQHIRQYAYFRYTKWPGGLYCTPTIAGSRPGSLTACCWATMMKFGEEGYMQRSKAIMKTVRNLRKGIVTTSGIKEDIELQGDGAAMVVCFTTAPACTIQLLKDKNNQENNNESKTSIRTRLNIYDIADKMDKKGWALNSLQKPAGLHLCVTLRHVGKEEQFLVDLKKSVEEVKYDLSCGMKSSGTAGVYGMASSLPAGPVKDMLSVYTDTVLKV